MSFEHMTQEDRKKIENLLSWKNLYVYLGTPNPIAAKQCTDAIDQIRSKYPDYKDTKKKQKENK